MGPTASLMLATDVNSYREALDPAAKLMARLEDHTHDFKGYVERPGGSTWSGLWATASQDKADGAWRTVVHARDAMDESARAMLNTIDYDIIPPLNNGKAILNNVHGQPGITVNDAECTLSYTAPEGMSKETADKNAKIVADASRELKDSATKWWAGVEKLKGQADASGNKVAGEFNLAAAMFNVNKAVADTKPKDVPAATPDDNFYKDWYPKAHTPASTEAAAATAPVDPHAPVLGPPTPEKSVDPSKLGTIGGTVDYLNKNATPPTPAKPEPPKKGFLDGWVDAAKQKAEGIVEHVGDLTGLHGADKAKDAWIDVGIGAAKDALKQAIPGADTPSALDQTIDAYNKAEYAKAHGGSGASLAGAGLFDIQAKSAEATAAIATGGTGRFLERGIVEGALGAEGRAALHEGIPTLDNTVNHTVKGFLDNALHSETPAAPHVETPAVPHAETPPAPRVETPPAPRAEIPTTPHLETPSAPHPETPAAPHAEPAPRADTPAVPRAETPATPHTPQPVEHTSPGAGHAETNSAPVEHNPTSPPAVTEHHPRSDGAGGGNPTIGDHSPVGGDHHPNGPVADHGGAPLRSPDDILHEARESHRAERDQMDWDRGEQNLQDLATHHGVSVDELPRTPQYDVDSPSYTDKHEANHSAEIDRHAQLWEHGLNTQSVQQVLDHMEAARPPSTEIRNDLREGLYDYGVEDLIDAGYSASDAKRLARDYADAQFPAGSGLIPQPVIHNPDIKFGGYTNGLTYGDWQVNNALGNLTKQESDAFKAWLKTQDPNAIVNIRLGRE